MKHIKLTVRINDWSLSANAPIEMVTGFDWVEALACSVVPFAVTSDALGDDWKNGRACLDLEIDWDGKSFGTANGAERDFG